SDFSYGTVFVSTSRTLALDAEGYLRELTRRIQQLRKDLGMKKEDRIALAIVCDDALLASHFQFHLDPMAEKVGADEISVLPREEKRPGATTKTYVIKEKTFVVSLIKKQ
ncbi:MAG: DUF5915 domain-containing protein, partial [Candidatus Woesearchaeota archaeon]